LICANFIKHNEPLFPPFGGIPKWKGGGGERGEKEQEEDRRSSRTPMIEVTMVGQAAY
jgi:hypothetical protein